MEWLDTFTTGFFAGVFGTVLLGCLLAKLLPCKDDYVPNSPWGPFPQQPPPPKPGHDTSTMHGDD